MTNFEALPIDLQILKAIGVRPGKTLDQYLQEEHPNGAWTTEGNIFTYAEPIQGRPEKAVEYQWGMDEEGLYAISGRACELTPEIDRQLVAIHFAESKVDAAELEVYQYVNELQKVSSDDEANAKKAAEHFGVPVEVINAIYPKVSEFIRVNSIVKK